MAKEKTISKTTTYKKISREEVEIILTTALSGIINGSSIPKQLHKKIKKAGKIITEGLHELKKHEAKKSATAKKTVKKAAPKKAAKKSVAK